MVFARTLHVCVQGLVDRSGVRGLYRSHGSALTLTTRLGGAHSAVPKVSGVFEDD
jgi:hypothetical protein